MQTGNRSTVRQTVEIIIQYKPENKDLSQDE